MCRRARRVCGRWALACRREPGGAPTLAIRARRRWAAGGMIYAPVDHDARRDRATAPRSHFGSLGRAAASCLRPPDPALCWRTNGAPPAPQGRSAVPLAPVRARPLTAPRRGRLTVHAPPPEMRLPSLLCAGGLLAAVLVACGTPPRLPATIPPAPGMPGVAYSLGMLDLGEGNGALSEERKCFYVHYTGWLTDGRKFDSSRDSLPTGQPREPLAFSRGARVVGAGCSSRTSSPTVPGGGRPGSLRTPNRSSMWS